MVGDHARADDHRGAVRPADLAEDGAGFGGALKGGIRLRVAVSERSKGRCRAEPASTGTGNPQRAGKERRGAGFLRPGDEFRRALGDDFAAAVAGFGADIEDPVGFGGDGHVVLDDDDGVAFVDEVVEELNHQLLLHL